MRSSVPSVRVTYALDAPVRPGGGMVLYWMTAYRRPYWNFALQRAVEWAAELRKPLLVFEPLNCGREWMSDRTHAFLLQGMADNARVFEQKAVFYFPYVERKRGESRGLLAALGASACVVVTDRFPAYIYPRMLQSASSQLKVRLEVVDSCGMLPLDATDQIFQRAFSFRKFIHKNLQAHLETLPCKDPLARVDLPRLKRLDAEISARWRPGFRVDLSQIDVDHSTAPAPLQGGWRAARQKLRRFAATDQARGSGLSPYLHFGHISSHEIYRSLNDRAEFMDELITWRELGFNMCAKRDDYDCYESLPDWAQRTLRKHASDRRVFVYSAEQLECARTHDALWNAAQRQLVMEGRIEPYLRMLWGKKILEWSPTPQRALSVMIDLNNKYALDGRDPNSYNGIMWILGRYDRPWGPERPIFGVVRYMSSESAARKLRARDYIQRYGEPHKVE